MLVIINLLIIVVVEGLRLGTISAAVAFVLVVPVVTGLICWYKAGEKP